MEWVEILPLGFIYNYLYILIIVITTLKTLLNGQKYIPTKWKILLNRSNSMAICHIFNVYQVFRLLSLKKKCPFKNIITIIGVIMSIICCISIKRT